MGISGLPVSEQETVIQFYRDESGAVIDTSDGTMITKIERLRSASPEHYKLEAIHTYQGGVECGRRYRLDDKGLISFRKGRVKLTEEQKAARAGRFQKQTV